jgi:hypothetical protein
MLAASAQPRIELVHEAVTDLRHAERRRRHANAHEGPAHTHAAHALAQQLAQLISVGLRRHWGGRARGG